MSKLNVFLRRSSPGSMSAFVNTYAGNSHPSGGREDFLQVAFRLAGWRCGGGFFASFKKLGAPVFQT